MTPFSVRLRGGVSAAAICAALFSLPGFSSAQATLVDVQWTNFLNTDASGSTLRKSAGCNGCPDAGATSLQALATDGDVEFTPSLGARLYVGLSSGTAASTDPALIDFAFSFWPDGGWDIRERNMYRSEGRFAAGDVFRLSVSAGVVRYYQNGTLVYTSLAAPAMPLVLDATLVGSGAVVTASITQDAPAPSAPPPADVTSAVPSTYDAISDRLVRTKGVLPELGPAGHEFSDPVFGSRMMRITDGTLRPGALDRSYRTPSGTHSNAWSADMRHFYTVSTDGTIIPFAFDPATMKATRLQPSTTGDGGLTLRFFNEPTFSYSTPGVLYGTATISGSNLRSVDQYDLATGQYSQLINLDALVPNLAGTYAGAVLASAGPSEKIVTFFGGPSQDRHMFMVVFEKGNPSNRHLVDTIASTVDGQVTNIPLNFKIHAAAIDRSGRYVIIYPTGTDLAAPRSAAPAYVWDTESNLFTALPLVATRSGGHDAYGYATRVNQDCCTSSTWDAAQWQFRSLATPLVSKDLITPILLPKEIYLADHPSWHNAQPDRLVPFIDATYRYGANTTTWRPWDEEIFAVQTDAPGTGATVWRFGHHRSNVANDADPSRISFWYTPRVNVSPDGQWALFTSNWEKTLGTDPKGEIGGASRQDLFLIRLNGATTAPPAPAPVSVTTTTLPSGMEKETYTAAVEATGGSGSVSWMVVAGALPPGVSLSGTTGVIAGTPTAAGSFGFTVRAVDVAVSGNFADARLTIAIAAEPAPPPVPPIDIVTTSLPDARRYVSYSATLASTGGQGSLTWSIVSGSLPSGLALNAATGVISGVPRNNQGTWSFTVRVVDSSPTPSASTQSLSIRVRK